MIEEQKQTDLKCRKIACFYHYKDVFTIKLTKTRLMWLR